MANFASLSQTKPIASPKDHPAAREKWSMQDLLCACSVILLIFNISPQPSISAQ